MKVVYRILGYVAQNIIAFLFNLVPRTFCSEFQGVLM